MSFKIWLKAIRAPFFTAGIIPVILGSVVAWHDTNSFMWARFFLTLFGVIFIHMGTNLANDYFDHRWGNDEANRTPTPFSGGSRVIQEGLIPPQKVLYVSIASFVVGGTIGIYLNYLCGGNVILFFGIVGVFLGFFYTAKPFRIGYGSLGELSVGIGFGPLVIMGSYYVQAQNVPYKVFLISIPIGILIMLVLFINEFPDYRADKSVGKRTLVVILGKKNAIRVYLILLATVYLTIISLVIYKFLPFVCLIALLSLPLALKACTVARKNFDTIYELLPANADTIALHSLVGLLLSAGMVLDKVF